MQAPPPLSPPSPRRRGSATPPPLFPLLLSKLNPVVAETAQGRAEKQRIPPCLTAPPGAGLAGERGRAPLQSPLQPH